MKNIESWIEQQKSFSSKCRSLVSEFFPKWGCYIYEIPFKQEHHNREKSNSFFPIWQLFCTSYCKETDLDYTYYFSAQKNIETIQPLYNRTKNYKEYNYDKIYDFIKKIKDEEEDVTCILGNSGLSEIYQINKLNDYHFGYLCKKLVSNNIISESNIITINDFYTLVDADYDNTAICSTIVFLELISENTCIRKVCQDIALMGTFFRKVICISLLKEYDRGEILKILEREKALIKKDEERLISLKSKVKDWDSLFGVIKYCYQYNYYPTTCDFDATNYEWTIRNLIWNFKNDPDKNISEYDHKVAMNRIITELEYKLKKTFGMDISGLVLVCIPASTKIKNENRYKEFSDIICRKLNMTNAFPFIEINKDRVAKHLGGTDITNLTFDNNFFFGKNVILFDDVVTKGRSMFEFYSKMISLGANIICAISIGKTKHDRDLSPSSW